MDVDEFLEFLFPNVNKDDPTEAVVVAEHKQEPGKQPYWEHTRWRPGTLPSPLGRHYFCISTVSAPPRDRKLRRRLTDLKRTFVIGLDDVGRAANSKVDPAKLPTPTLRVESSPGNEQWLYKLDRPALPADAAALIAALARAGYTDKGSQGTNRVLRLPGSLNDKYDQPFRARVIHG
jgi:hypothetical protein